MTSGRQAVGVALLTIAAACGLTRCSPAPPAPPTLTALAQSYVRLTLKLAQHDPQLVESWRGSADWKPGPRQPVAPLLADAETLQRELETRSANAGDGARIAYLAGQIKALHLAAERLLGKTTTFNDEARLAFGITPQPIDSANLERARQALDRELPGHGPLAERYAAFKRRLAIQKTRVEGVMKSALEVCRSATLQQISLPSDERVDLVFGTASSWDGYARYQGDHRTRIEIDREAALDVTRALRLACHEGYPGHHVQYLWIDDELVRKRQWLEFELAPAFGRHLLVVEGAAEAGVDVLFPDERRLAVYRDTLLPAAGQPPQDAAKIVRIESLIGALEPAIGDVVGRYLDNSLTQAAALEHLRNDTLTTNAESLLAFAEHRRSRMLVYPEGRALLRRLIGDGGLAALRRVFVDHLFAVQ